MKSYGQFCPVAKAAEILNERWTLLIIRELLCGSTRFNELRRGVPLMSSSLLSQRLKSLEKLGIIERRSSKSQHRSEYGLTAAGEELRPIVLAFGEWGQRWVRSQVLDGDLDAGLLMWDMRRTLDPRKFSSARTTIQFEYIDVPSALRRWWLVIQNDQIELCIKDPGFEIDLFVTSRLRAMTQIWMGDISLGEARKIEMLDLQGNPRLIRDLSNWFTRALFADVERPSRRTSEIEASEHR